jgi:hypothetical protein
MIVCCGVSFVMKHYSGRYGDGNTVNNKFYMVSFYAHYIFQQLRINAHNLVINYCCNAASM